VRKIFLACVAFILSTLPVFAADLGVRQPVYKAPPVPVTVTTWTGCYIGGNVGYGWAPTKWSDGGIEFASHTADGVVGGGQIGCDYQSGAWVFGIQGMFDAADLKGSSVNSFLDPGGRVVDSTKVSWLATLTGRVGYTIQPLTLLYVKGGAAWVHSKFNECCEPTVVLQDELGPIGDGYANVTRIGWTVGAGIEHMFMPHWSVFLEYDFIDIGTKTTTFTPINSTPSPFNYKIDQNVNLFLAGLNYRF
jgi:outer membrane immunogenic protein